MRAGRQLELIVASGGSFVANVVGGFQPQEPTRADLALENDRLAHLALQSQLGYNQHLLHLGHNGPNKPEWWNGRHAGFKKKWRLGPHRISLGVACSLTWRCGEPSLIGPSVHYRFARELPVGHFVDCGRTPRPTRFERW